LLPIDADATLRRGVHREQGDAEAERLGAPVQRVGRWRGLALFPGSQRCLGKPATSADFAHIQAKRPTAHPEFFDDWKVASHVRRPDLTTRLFPRRCSTGCEAPHTSQKNSCDGKGAWESAGSGEIRQRLEVADQDRALLDRDNSGALPILQMLVDALASALRSLPSRRAISPNTSLSRKIVTTSCRPSSEGLLMTTRPLSTAIMLLPGSPLAKICSPSA